MSEAKAGLTRKIIALTTAVFRCRGLDTEERPAPAEPRRALFFWTAFLLVVTAWYLFLFDPTREKNELLRARLLQLEGQLRAEETDLRRTKDEVRALVENDRRAWERAARAQLGWLKPGELLNPPAATPGPSTPAPAPRRSEPHTMLIPRPDPTAGRDVVARDGSRVPSVPAPAASKRPR
jgi:hypothetical protein